MTACHARPDRYGTMRCTACRVAWDRDDVAACPRQVPLVPQAEPLYASALAPDIYADMGRRAANAAIKQILAEYRRDPSVFK